MLRAGAGSSFVEEPGGAVRQSRRSRRDAGSTGTPAGSVNRVPPRTDVTVPGGTVVAAISDSSGSARSLDPPASISGVAEPVSQRSQIGSRSRMTYRSGPSEKSAAPACHWVSTRSTLRGPSNRSASTARTPRRIGSRMRVTARSRTTSRHTAMTAARSDPTPSAGRRSGSSCG